MSWFESEWLQQTNIAVHTHKHIRCIWSSRGITMSIIDKHDEYKLKITCQWRARVVKPLLTYILSYAAIVPDVGCLRYVLFRLHHTVSCRNWGFPLVLVGLRSQIWIKNVFALQPALVKTSNRRASSVSCQHYGRTRKTKHYYRP